MSAHPVAAHAGLLLGDAAHEVRTIHGIALAHAEGRYETIVWRRDDHFLKEQLA